MDLNILQEFFLKCLIINLAMYLFTVVAVLAMRDFMINIQSKMFKLDKDTVHRAVYGYIAAYKLLIIVFNFTPWLALALMR